MEFPLRAYNSRHLEHLQACLPLSTAKWRRRYPSPCRAPRCSPVAALSAVSSVSQRRHSYTVTPPPKGPAAPHPGPPCGLGNLFCVSNLFEGGLSSQIEGNPQYEQSWSQLFNAEAQVLTSDASGCAPSIQPICWKNASTFQHFHCLSCRVGPSKG